MIPFVILPALRPTAVVHCQCGGGVCGDYDPETDTYTEKDGKTYLCPGCLRNIPWCCGAADDMPELCDDCWAIFNKENEDDRENNTRTDQGIPDSAQ